MTRIIWAGGALLCLASLNLYGFETNNPSPLRWAALSVLVSSAAITWIWAGAAFAICRTTLIGLMFVAYAAMSILWSPDWREGLLSLYDLVLLAGLFLIVLHADRGKVTKVVLVVASAAILVSVFADWDMPGAFGGMGNENFQSEFLLLLVPAALLGRIVWEGRFIGALCLMAACVALFILFFGNLSHAKWAGIAWFGVLFVIALYRAGYVGTAITMAMAGFACVYYIGTGAGQSHHAIRGRGLRS